MLLPFGEFLICDFNKIIVFPICSNEKKKSGVSSQQQKRKYYRNREKVILPCGNMLRGQKCDQIQWWFSASQDSSLVPTLQPGPWTNREIHREDCALVMRQVQVEDVGLYTCTQGSRTLVQVHLDVVTCKYHIELNGCWRTVFVSSLISSWSSLHLVRSRQL